MRKREICHLLSIFAVEVRGGAKLSLFLMWWRFVCWHCRSSEKVQGGTAPARKGSSAGNDAWWAHVWCMMVPRLVWQNKFQSSLLASRLETAFFTSILHLLSAAFHWYLTSLFSTPHHTLACLNLWKTLFVEEVRMSDEVRNSWRMWGFYGLKRRCPAVSQPGPPWQVCVRALSCRRWFPDVVINSSQTVRRRVTLGPEARRKELRLGLGLGLHHRAAPQPVLDPGPEPGLCLFSPLNVFGHFIYEALRASKLLSKIFGISVWNCFPNEHYCSNQIRNEEVYVIYHCWILNVCLISNVPVMNVSF